MQQLQYFNQLSTARALQKALSARALIQQSVLVEDSIMTRVLLTGGSGFIAVHVLEALLAQGHSVVTSVRSETKAQMLRDTFPDVGKDRLDFVFVADIAQEGAFDEAVKSDPPFEWALHTASPFHFNITDTKKDLLDPAIIGTTGFLKAIKKNAPTVKRVVSTSDFFLNELCRQLITR